MDNQNRFPPSYFDLIQQRHRPSLPCLPSSPVPDIELDELEERAVDSNDVRVNNVLLFGIPIVGLTVENKERLCLAQISNTLLREFSYNEIHNRRVALGITCMQCSASQLEILRRTGAMPISSRRCGLITKREAERLVKSFVEEISPPRLPDDFSFQVKHHCGWGCKGLFQPSRYNSSRAKCIKCFYCDNYFSPNKFIFHYHKLETSEYRHPDAANFNSWRRHLYLTDENPQDSLLHAWEDVKAMFNGGCRKRFSTTSRSSSFDLESRSLDTHASPISTNSQASMNLPSYFPVQQPPLAHSAFPNLFRGITSYGDFLRSLSVPYGNFPARIGDATPPLFPFGTSGSGMMLPSSSIPTLPEPIPSNNHWYGRPAVAATVKASHNPVLDDKPKDIIKETNDSQIDSFGKLKVDAVGDTKYVSSPNIELKNACFTVASSSNRVTSEIKDLVSQDICSDTIEGTFKASEKNEDKTTCKEADVSTTDISSFSEEELKRMIAKARSERIEAEKQHEQMKDLLQSQSQKENELKQELEKELNNIKEKYLCDIHDEKKFQRSLEDKIADTMEILTRLTSQTTVI